MAEGVAKSLAKNSLWLILGEVINGALMFVMTVFLARYLLADGYGKLMFALSLATLFIIPMDLGLGSLTIRELAGEKDKTKKYLDNLVLVRIILSTLVFLVMVLVVQFLKEDNDIRILVYFLGIWTIFQSVTQFFQAVFRAHEKMFFEALTRILHVLVLVTLSLYFIWYKFDIIYFGLAYCVAAFATLLLAFYFIWKKFSHFSLKLDFIFLKKTFSKSWPFALSLLFASINYYIDSVMLGIIKGNEEVGWYNAAYKLLIFILLIGSVVSRSTYPIISKLYKKSLLKLAEFLEKYSRFMLIIAFPLAFGGVILAAPLIKLIYGDGFSEAILPFQILIFSAATIYISTVYAHSLQACQKQKTHLIGMGIGALINISLNLILIPKYSLVGAAIATLITEMFIFLFMYLKFSKTIKLPILKYIIRPLISSVLMFIFLYFLSSLNPFILLALGVLIYFSLMLLIKGIHREDFLAVKSLLGKE